MKKFIIQQYETTIFAYEVEAENLTEALLAVRCGEADMLEQIEIEPIVNSDIGLSFEEVEDMDIDLERIRSEFNEDRNSEFLESIHKIEEVK